MHGRGKFVRFGWLDGIGSVICKYMYICVASGDQVEADFVFFLVCDVEFAFHWR